MLFIAFLNPINREPLVRLFRFFFIFYFFFIHYTLHRNRFKPSRGRRRCVSSHPVIYLFLLSYRVIYFLHKGILDNNHDVRLLVYTRGALLQPI